MARVLTPYRRQVTTRTGNRGQVFVGNRHFGQLVAAPAAVPAWAGQPVGDPEPEPEDDDE